MTNTMKNREEILSLIHQECTRSLILLENKRKKEQVEEIKQDLSLYF